MKPLFTQKGFWNGQHIATFTACIIIPKVKEDKPMYWCNLFAGKERQAIEITYNGETWCIDNNTGSGYYKVTIGLGSPQCGHKSFGEYDLVRYIPHTEMICNYSQEMEANEEAAIQAYQKEKDPQEYERMQSLINSMRKYQAMSTTEKIAHINSMSVKPAPQSKKFNSSLKKDGKGKR